MGACCTSTNPKERRSSNLHSNINLKPDLAPESESMMEYKNNRYETENPVRNYILNGDSKQIQSMFDSKEILPNQFVFSSGDKTILHEAVILSDSSDLIETILNNGADVNAKEKTTGNSAIFLASLDLKVEIVRSLLKFRPDITIKNDKGQTVFSFLNEHLIEKKGPKKTELTPEQSEKLMSILDLLKDYRSKIESVENLDDDRNDKRVHDESGEVGRRM